MKKKSDIIDDLAISSKEEFSEALKDLLIDRLAEKAYQMFGEEIEQELSKKQNKL